MAGEPAVHQHVLEKITPKYGTIKKVIAVMSGKGGVGKSTVSALLALTLARRGQRTGILDADVTGPSIPKMFGLRGGVEASPGGGIKPAGGPHGLKIMSLNLLLPAEDDPVIWRGPLISGTVKQFWEEVAWGELDYLVVDLPPGTGDVPLTVMQSVPLEGLLIVSSPQELALMVVRKAIKMAQHMEMHVLGLVENMSYVLCPQCGAKIEAFGPSRAAEAARTTGVPLLGMLPLDPQLGELCDTGRIAEYANGEVKEVFSRLIISNPS